MREGNLFSFKYVSPTSLYGSNVTSAALTAARAIVNLYQSAKPINATSLHEVITKLYPVKEYAEVAANLSMFFGGMFPGLTMSPTNATVAQLALGDFMFTCSAELTSSVISNFAASRDAYLYLFNHTSSNAALALLGPTHTSEMAYVFGTFDAYVDDVTFHAVPKWTPTTMEQAMSQSMMDYWLNFARYLNPNGGDGGGGDSNAEVWPAAGCGVKNNFMVFGDKGPGASG